MTAVRLHSESLTIATRGRGTRDITEAVQAIVRRSDIEAGQCTAPHERRITVTVLGA